MYKKLWVYRGILKYILLISFIVTLVKIYPGIQAALYLIFIDDLKGETILQNEPNVRKFLENIIEKCENYSMKVSVRTGIYYQIKRTKLLTHTYYVIVSDDGEYHTLSYYGTDMAFSSKGAWALDADSDRNSYTMYLEENNKWDVVEMEFPRNNIDVRQTLRNIINSMDSGVTYYYRAHIKSKPNTDNCNTALFKTIVFENDTVIDEVDGFYPPGTVSVTEFFRSLVIDFKTYLNRFL